MFWRKPIWPMGEVLVFDALIWPSDDSADGRRLIRKREAVLFRYASLAKEKSRTNPQTGAYRTFGRGRIVWQKASRFFVEPTTSSSWIVTDVGTDTQHCGQTPK